VRQALASALLLAGLAAVPAHAAPRNVVVTDGFTASAVAGAQAVVHLAHPTPPPGPLGSGPPVDLSVSSGPIAGFALVAVRGKAYAAVVETTQQHTCGRADCGPDAYTRDAVSWTGTKDDRLPAGDYRLVLLGARGARVTATLRSSTKRHAPVRVPLVASRYSLDVSPTVATTPGLAGAQPTDRGSYHHAQSAHRALVGVVHTVEIQYGSSLDYTLCAGRTATSGECGGTHRVGSEELTNNDPATMPLDMAVTPMYATHVLLVPSDDVEADVGGSWQATVYAGRATQRGLGVYVPLEIG
jgi:hypothetical protein